MECAIRSRSKIALANDLALLAREYLPSTLKKGVLFGCGMDNQLNRKAVAPSMKGRSASYSAELRRIKDRSKRLGYASLALYLLRLDLCRKHFFHT